MCVCVCECVCVCVSLCVSVCVCVCVMRPRSVCCSCLPGSQVVGTYSSLAECLFYSDEGQQVSFCPNKCLLWP